MVEVPKVSVELIRGGHGGFGLGLGEIDDGNPFFFSVDVTQALICGDQVFPWRKK